MSTPADLLYAAPKEDQHELRLKIRARIRQLVRWIYVDAEVKPERGGRKGSSLQYDLTVMVDFHGKVRVFACNQDGELMGNAGFVKVRHTSPGV